MPFGIIDLIEGSPDYGGMAAAQERKRQKAITEGTTAINEAFSGFTPTFYSQRAQDYVGYAMPEVGRQYRRTQKNIGFNLTNRGLQRSSAGQRQWGDLFDTYTTAKQNVADEGQRQAQELKERVEASRDAQLAFLYQGADPAQAAQSATAAAASFRVPSTFPAVADQFQSLLNTYYYSQLVNAYRPTSFVALPPSSTSGPNLGQPSYSVGE